MRPPEEISLVNQEPPPAEFQMDYWKTRVERVIDRTVMILGNNVATLQFVLSERTMMLGKGLDPREGMMFIRLTGPTAGISSVLAGVAWELPGGLMPYQYATYSLTMNEVTQIRLWEGPIPGPVRLILIFDRNDFSAEVSIVADVVVRRKGGNFDHGMRLHIADPPIARMPVGPYEPPEEEGDGPPPPNPCLPRPSEPVRQGQGGSTERLEYGFTPVGGSCEPGGLEACDPDASAQDWWASTDIRCPSFPDPEITAMVDYFGGNLFPDVNTKFILGPRMGFSGASPNNFGIDIVFPDDYPELAEYSGRPIAEYIGRCDGFYERWLDVTQGLDVERMPPVHQRLLLSVPRWGVPIHLGWDPVDGMVQGGSDFLSAHWDWNNSAIWLDEDLQQTWFVMSQLNLLYNTIDLLPKQLTSIVEDGRFARTKANCFNRGRCRENRIQSSQADWRFDGRGPSFLKIFASGRDRLSTNGSLFQINTLNWGQGIWDQDTVNEITGSSASRGVGTNLPLPIPSLIRYNAHTWVPYVRAAAELYALARLLTMISMRLNDGASEEVLKKAKLVYRAYLSCLAVPGKTLVHEVFHTNKTWVLLNNKRTDHCGSGCGQERMATAWIARLAHEYGLLRVDTNVHSTGLLHPSRFLPNAVRWPQAFSSVCLGGDSPVAVTTNYKSWPIEPGESVTLEWVPTFSGNVNMDVRNRFARKCMADTITRRDL